MLQCAVDHTQLKRAGKKSFAAVCQKELEKMTNVQIKEFIIAILKRAYPDNHDKNTANSRRKLTNKKATREVREGERGAKNTPHNYPPLARAHVREERERRKERKRENTTHAHACTRPRLPRASPAGFACAYCWLLLCLLLLLRVLSQKAHELENELEAGSLRSLSPLPAPRPSKNNKGSMLYLCNLDSRLEVVFFAFFAVI